MIELNNFFAFKESLKIFIKHFTHNDKYMFEWNIVSYRNNFFKWELLFDMTLVDIFQIRS